MDNSESPDTRRRHWLGRRLLRVSAGDPRDHVPLQLPLHRRAAAPDTQLGGIRLAHDQSTPSRTPSPQRPPSADATAAARRVSSPAISLSSPALQAPISSSSPPRTAYTAYTAHTADTADTIDSALSSIDGVSSCRNGGSSDRDGGSCLATPSSKTSARLEERGVRSADRTAERKSARSIFRSQPLRERAGRYETPPYPPHYPPNISPLHPPTAPLTAPPTTPPLHPSTTTPLHPLPSLSNEHVLEELSALGGGSELSALVTASNADGERSKATLGQAAGSIGSSGAPRGGGGAPLRPHPKSALAFAPSPSLPSRSPPSAGHSAGPSAGHSAVHSASPPLPDETRVALYTCGLNSSGQLGLGDFLSRVIPHAVEALAHTSLAAVACGSRTTLVIDEDGRVFAWGKGEDGTLGVADDRANALRPKMVEGLINHPMSALACRGAHVLALTRKGQVWAWGRNDDGQLGVLNADGTLAHHLLPRRVRALIGVRVVAVACGRTHSVALDQDGALYSWGSGDDGVLGHGDTESRRAPTRCEALRGRVLAAIACGSRHTLALAADGDGELFSWGWGVYGQLGHGDTRVRLRPVEVEALLGTSITRLACGYRHSLVCTREHGVWAWGWGRHGQLGIGSWTDESLPQRVAELDHVEIVEIQLGGRHSLALSADGELYTWGRDEDGQLGRGATGASARPRLVESLADDENVIRVRGAACGWSHTALLVEARRLPRASAVAAAAAPTTKRPLVAARVLAAAAAAPPLLVRGDVEGLFAQLLGTFLTFTLAESLLRGLCGFSVSMLEREFMPGMAAAYLLGHAFFARQASNLTASRGGSKGGGATALPHGVNIVPFFAFINLVMAPAYRAALKRGGPDAAPEDAARAAYDAGLGACLLLGALELVGLLFVERLRRAIPRAAMLSAIAGVSLTFISLSFLTEIFAAPATALLPMILMLVFYAGKVELPAKLPGGLAALATSAAISAGAAYLGYEWSEPREALAYAPELALPQLQLRFVRVFARPEFWHAISVVVPMWLVSLINNLANLESAAAVGDQYAPRRCMLAIAILDLGCVALGCPFPTCIYIGHSAFKAMGAKSGYLYLSMLPAAFFGFLQGARLMRWLFPIEGGVGFLMWIGLQITAQGFEGDLTPDGWRHGPAVALGLVPSICAWSWQSVAATFTATRNLLCDGGDGGGLWAGGGDTPRPEVCALALESLIQPASTPLALDGSRRAFQSSLSSLFLSGTFALANGYLLSAIILSSMLVHLIDGNFHLAAAWLSLAAAAASIGVIHAPILDPIEADQRYSAMYLASAVILLFVHTATSRTEQLKELQVKLSATVQQLLPPRGRTGGRGLGDDETRWLGAFELDGDRSEPLLLRRSMSTSISYHLPPRRAPPKGGTDGGSSSVGASPVKKPFADRTGGGAPPPAFALTAEAER